MRETHGLPLAIRLRFDSKEDSVNEKGLVVEASYQSINIRREISIQGDINFSMRYHDGQFRLASPYRSELASDKRKHA
jgi:hypothetical protein